MSKFRRQSIVSESRVWSALLPSDFSVIREIIADIRSECLDGDEDIVVTSDGEKLFFTAEVSRTELG